MPCTCTRTPLDHRLSTIITTNGLRIGIEFRRRIAEQYVFITVSSFFSFAELYARRTGKGVYCWKGKYPTVSNCGVSYIPRYPEVLCQIYPFHGVTGRYYEPITNVPFNSHFTCIHSHVPHRTKVWSGRAQTSSLGLDQ